MNINKKPRTPIYGFRKNIMIRSYKIMLVHTTGRTERKKQRKKMLQDLKDKKQEEERRFFYSQKGCLKQQQQSKIIFMCISPAPNGIQI